MPMESKRCMVFGGDTRVWIRNAEKKIAKLEAEGGDVEELRARLARKWDDEEYY